MAGARQRYLEGVATEPLGYVYRTEDAEALRAILGRRYHVVVGNPPYITPKDKALNQGYRERFGSCYRQYSLAVPFTERFFDLAHAPAPDAEEPAGFVGMITANSFMKREFGRKLIEEFIPRWDMTQVVDTSGAYIPGHGTPTVILFGRHRRPVAGSVRTVMGISGEPAIPNDPATGLVWSAIVAQINQAGSESEFVSVSDVPRERFRRHPWSIGGGGAAELREQLAETARIMLSDVASDIGCIAVTREDDCFRIGTGVARRHGVAGDHIRPLVAGEEVRDWRISRSVGSIWPYDPLTLETVTEGRIVAFLWPWRTQLASRVAFGKSQIEHGLQWHEYSMFFRERFRNPLSIAFADISTHNQLVLERRGSVFTRTAPVIKLPADTSSEDDHLGILGLMNSSTACFWMKQVFHNKGLRGIGDGITTEKWEQFFAFDGTKLKKFPVPGDRPIDLAQTIDSLAQERTRGARM